MPDFSRRDILSGAMTLALQPGLKAKVNAAPLSGSYYRDYSRCLPDYLSGLAREAYQKRNRQLSLLTNVETIRKRQAWVRETFWKLVGGKPERTPLNARVTGHFERDGYRLEKIVYEGQPRVFISANCYIPTKQKAPYPGVLFQMGHYYTGKAYASYQKCCQGLARLGYMVLAFDPMGQGERINYPDASGTNTRLSSIDDEHERPGKQFLLLGNSATRYQVWDAIRSLDYLAAHPLVDADRLASAGQSGGGTLSMLLACADERLAAVAISSGNTENLACANFQAPGSTDDAEQDLIGSGPEGFDRWDLLYPMVPKPVLIQVSAHDFFGTYSPRYLDDGLEQYKKLADLYGVFGVPDRLGWNSTPMTHGLTYSLRLGIYNWFERWLLHSERNITAEPPVSPEPDQTVWVSKTGNVTRDFDGLKPFDWVKQNAAGIHRGRSGVSWNKLLPVRQPSANLKFRKLSDVALGDVSLAAMEVNSAADVWIPTWAFIPARGDSGHPPLLVLDDRGRNLAAHEDGVYHRLASAGRRVYVADIRGLGDMRPEVGRGNPAYTVEHDAEEEFAWASLILGESILAQRITDILALERAILNEPFAAGKQLAITARGRLTVPALFAFASSHIATSLYLAAGLASFESLLETENYQQPLASFAWDLFHSTDLPLLAAQAAPRRIHLAGTVNGANVKMDIREVQRIYAATVAAGSTVQISPEAAWNEPALGWL
jgi:dienelactone hydrolase